MNKSMSMARQKMKYKGNIKKTIFGEDMLINILYHIV